MKKHSHSSYGSKYDTILKIHHSLVHSKTSPLFQYLTMFWMAIIILRSGKKNWKDIGITRFKKISINKKYTPRRNFLIQEQLLFSSVKYLFITITAANTKFGKRTQKTEFILRSLEHTRKTLKSGKAGSKKEKEKLGKMK